MGDPTRRSRARLGRTELEVCRIGVGGGNGLSARDLGHAIDQGVDFIFTSCDLHAPMYGRSWEAIAAVCGAGQARRDIVTLAVASYINDPDKILATVADQLYALRVDHIDLFMWGWVTPGDLTESFFERTRATVCTASGRAPLDALRGTTRELQDALRSRGYARYIGVSTHDRRLAARIVQDYESDVIMFRYNPAHRGAETDVFPALAGSQMGAIAFNTGNLAELAAVVERLPATKYRPVQSDLYRFALDRQEIDLVLAGPRTRTEVADAIDALDRAPLDPELRAYLEQLGDLRTGKASVTSTTGVRFRLPEPP